MREQTLHWVKFPAINFPSSGKIFRNQNELLKLPLGLNDINSMIFNKIELFRKLV